MARRESHLKALAFLKEKQTLRGALGGICHATMAHQGLNSEPTSAVVSLFGQSRSVYATDCLMQDSKQSTVCRMTEHPKLEGANKDHGVQLLAPHRITQKSDFMSESVVQMLLQLWQLGAMILESLFHAYHPLVKNLFLISNLTLP